jgi:hypothetical protein
MLSRNTGRPTPKPFPTIHEIHRAPLSGSPAKRIREKKLQFHYFFTPLYLRLGTPGRFPLQFDLIAINGGRGEIFSL